MIGYFKPKYSLHNASWTYTFKVEPTAMAVPITLYLSGLICLFGVLCRFQHCTGHIMMGSWKGRGNQYIQFVRVLYCKVPTNGKQLSAFQLEAMLGTEPRPQRWEARVLPLCHRVKVISHIKKLFFVIWMFPIITSLVPVCLDAVSLVIGHTRNGEFCRGFPDSYILAIVFHTLNITVLNCIIYVVPFID